jgi:hypothetical protein
MRCKALLLVCAPVSSVVGDMPVLIAATHRFDVGTANSSAELYATISAALGRPCPSGP